MKVFADLHLHSKYSRGTSRYMDIFHLSSAAKKKGLNLLGTGDFTHPLWFKEIKSRLSEHAEGVYEFDGIYYLLTCEVCNTFEREGKTRRIHNLILAKDFACVEQVNEILKRYGNLEKDGRPTLTLPCEEMVELLKGEVKDVEIIPAHIWTPWFSLFGSRSGFNSVRECFGEESRKILALETGLSSDPAMNWRLSELDGFALVSFSDAHSPSTLRLGRECCVFELKDLSYDSLIRAIRKRDEKRFIFTIEVDPSYGKYHYDGHRKCGISLHPKEAMKYANLCPVCGKPLTVGVLHRVEELADREEGYVPKHAIPFKKLLPLREIISHTIGENTNSAKVVKIEEKLIRHFGSELAVLLHAEEAELRKIAGERIAENVMKNRREEIRIVPGYDGVYGIPLFGEESKSEKPERGKILQRRIDSFF